MKKPGKKNKAPFKEILGQYPGEKEYTAGISKKKKKIRGASGPKKNWRRAFPQI